MRTNIKMIKVTGMSSLLLAIITYFITIKGYLGISENQWIPDSFLLAAVGGVFASMLVVLLCEVSKYFINKESTETYLFSHLYYLYGQLLIIQRNIDSFISQENPVPRNALSQLIANAEGEMNSVYYKDYAAFRKSNGVLKIKQDYNERVFSIVQSFLLNCKMLEIATIADELIENKRKIGANIEPGNNIHLVLAKLQEQIKEPLMSIDTLLQQLNQQCRGRYNWPQLKDSIEKGLPSYNPDMLGSFLKKE